MLNITEAHYSCEEDLEAARLTTSRLNSEQCEQEYHNVQHSFILQSDYSKIITFIELTLGTHS